MGALWEIAAVFLTLGVVAVGGPAVHVALMRRQIVEKRHWLDEAAFLDAFAATQLIPGPSSTELAMLLGYRRGGVAGLLTAGSIFILPAALIMLGLAWVYQRFYGTPLLSHALAGVRPMVVGIIAWALLDLGRRIVRSVPALLASVAVLVAGLLGVNPVLLLFLGGLVFTLRVSLNLARKVRRFFSLPLAGKGGFFSLPLAGRVGEGVLAALAKTSLLTIFLTFLKYGAVSFGSGYVLFALLHSDVVQHDHWLTTSQLIDAIAISQATPGPVFTVATFIGFLVHGISGALVATLGIFLPGFLMVPFLDRIVRLVRDRAWARAFLEGINVAALGLIAEVAIQLGRASLVDVPSTAMAVIAFAVLLRAPLAAPLLVLGGAVLGVVGLR